MKLLDCGFLCIYKKFEDAKLQSISVKKNLHFTKQSIIFY